jgi:hypothetical protein
MRIRLLALLVLVTLGPTVVAGSKATGAATPPYRVTPVPSGNVTGSPIIINTSPGNQTDPHVSGDLVAYTDENGSFGSLIRYYDFVSATHDAIVVPIGSTDQLSNVDGNHISFARQTGPNRELQVFDVTTWNTVQVGGDNSGAFSTALGGDTAAFVSGDDIKVGRISNPGGSLANLSSSAAIDSQPAVSPNGQAVVWQECTFFSCSVLRSTFNGAAWSSPVVVANAPPMNTDPDTDGTSIAYDSDRSTSVDGSDIYFQSLSGGVDTQLSLAGAQRRPRISQGVIAFESTALGASSADLFLYEISSNRLFQVTDTPGLDELLSDITVLADGSIRVVWASHPDFSSDSDIFAQTFSLPQQPPSPSGFQICLLYDPLVAKKSGTAYPIKLQLCDANGHNLSSPSIAVHATSVSQASTNAPGPLDDTGNANPDFDFRYDAALGGTGGYIFNLSLRGFSTGTYNLNLTVGVDPAVHAVSFAVR